MAYDMSPTSWSGGAAISGVGAQRRRGAPAQMTAAVPSAGSSAATPGNGVASEYDSAVTAIAAIPAQPVSARTGAGTPSDGRASASSPPAPNSHARVGVTKYAAAGLAAVWQIE